MVVFYNLFLQLCEIKESYLLLNLTVKFTDVYRKIIPNYC